MDSNYQPPFASEEMDHAPSQEGLRGSAYPTNATNLGATHTPIGYEDLVNLLSRPDISIEEAKMYLTQREQTIQASVQERLQQSEIQHSALRDQLNYISQEKQASDEERVRLLQQLRVLQQATNDPTNVGSPTAGPSARPEPLSERARGKLPHREHLSVAAHPPNRPNELTRQFTPSFATSRNPEPTNSFGSYEQGRYSPHRREFRVPHLAAPTAHGAFGMSSGASPPTNPIRGRNDGLQPLPATLPSAAEIVPDHAWDATNQFSYASEVGYKVPKLPNPVKFSGERKSTVRATQFLDETYDWLVGSMANPELWVQYAGMHLTELARTWFTHLSLDVKGKGASWSAFKGIFHQRWDDDYSTDRGFQALFSIKQEAMKNRSASLYVQAFQNVLAVIPPSTVSGPVVLWAFTQGLMRHTRVDVARTAPRTLAEAIRATLAVENAVSGTRPYATNVMHNPYVDPSSERSYHRSYRRDRSDPMDLDALAAFNEELEDNEPSPEPDTYESTEFYEDLEDQLHAFNNGYSSSNSRRFKFTPRKNLPRKALPAGRGGGGAASSTRSIECHVCGANHTAQTCPNRWELKQKRLTKTINAITDVTDDNSEGDEATKPGKGPGRSA